MVINRPVGGGGYSQGEGITQKQLLPPESPRQHGANSQTTATGSSVGRRAGNCTARTCLSTVSRVRVSLHPLQVFPLVMWLGRGPLESFKLLFF